MIWGEVINSVRRLHLFLVQECGVDPTLFTRDIPISGTLVPFPDSIDDFEEWEETPLPSELHDLLPLHPVERALIEGSLLPIQIIRFKTPREIESLFDAIIVLERKWMESSGTSSSDRLESVRNFLRAETLKLQVRAGLRTLAPTKDKTS